MISTHGSTHFKDNRKCRGRSMKTLRDEIGHVFVHSRPEGMRIQAPNAALEPHKTPSVTVPERKLEIKANSPIQHCCLYCRWCGACVLLPHESLGLAFAHPSIRSLQVRGIGSVCEFCHHVSAFSLFRGSAGFDTRNKVIAAEPSGKTILVDKLKCVESTCESPLHLFVSWEGDVSVERLKKRAIEWLWDELKCTSGHIIRRPKWAS